MFSYVQKTLSNEPKTDALLNYAFFRILITEYKGSGHIKSCKGSANHCKDSSK